MRKRRDILLNSREARGRLLVAIALAGLTICAALLSHILLFSGGATAHVSSPPTPVATSKSYLYFVLKQGDAFVLARARAGADDQPTDSPQILASFDDGFGESSGDSVISLQLSPDTRFLAIDGTRSDGEFLWIFDTSRKTLKREPANVSGTFLHWLSKDEGIFLYRPILPLGPDAPLKGAGDDWNPGLWIGNALTDTFTNIDIHMPASLLVDAISAPDDSEIIYSTSSGMGMGSDIWSVDLRGGHRVHLLQLSDDDDDDAQDIAGMFSWSPDGQSIAYERLDDGPTPFLPAGLWLMDRQGGHQRLLAEVDGGHGFSLRWSPDSTKIAFVARTNPSVSMADQTTQALQSAIQVAEVSSGHTWTVASPAETGVQMNVNPTWDANSSQITFAAFNPLNPVIGGSVRYWSAQVKPKGARPQAVQVSQAITQVVAFD